MSKTLQSRIMARLVIACFIAHEKSYDKVAAGKASKERDQGASCCDGYFAPVDYASFYRLSLEEACVKICTERGEPDLTMPVFLMLKSWSNDSLDWAYGILGLPAPGCHVPTEEPPEEPAVTKQASKRAYTYSRDIPTYKERKDKIWAEKMQIWPVSHLMDEEIKELRNALDSNSP